MAGNGPTNAGLLRPMAGHVLAMAQRVFAFGCLWWPAMAKLVLAFVGQLLAMAGHGPANVNLRWLVAGNVSVSVVGSAVFCFVYSGQSSTQMDDSDNGEAYQIDPAHQ